MRFLINRDLIRFANYAVMIFGHCIIIWWPEVWYLRLGDWFCYPVFALLAGYSLVNTSDAMKYLSSMILLALVSQYPYTLAGVGRAGSLNIMVPLAFSVGIVWMSNHFNDNRILVLGILGALFGNMSLVVVGALIIFFVTRFYEYLPEMRVSRKLKINKYFIWSIYPVHLMILGSVRYMTQ